MSKLNRSLACEEVEVSQDMNDLFPMHYLSVGNVSAPLLTLESVVVVSGSITVSF